VDPEGAAFLQRFWEAYNRYSASELYRMTHAEMPWRKTWEAKPNANAPIGMEDIVEYFAGEDVPGPLARYRHEFRKREEEAEAKIRSMTPLYPVRLRAAARSFTPAARRIKSAGG
jgi:hypothetical protein